MRILAARLHLDARLSDDLELLYWKGLLQLTRAIYQLRAQARLVRQHLWVPVLGWVGGLILGLLFRITL